MTLRPPIVLALLAAASLPLAAAPAREGKQVYDETCSVCHAQGRDGAPKVGDLRAWSKLSERGLSSLSYLVQTSLRPPAK